MSDKQAPNIPGFSANPITVRDEDEEGEEDVIFQGELPPTAAEEDVVEIGEFDADRDVPTGLARELRNVAYERAQDVDQDVLESLSTRGGPASNQIKIVEQMQIEQAVRMSLPGNQEPMAADDLAALEEAQLAAALRESEEFARTQSHSEDEEIQLAIAMSRRESTEGRGGRRNWWEQAAPGQTAAPNPAPPAPPDVRPKQPTRMVVQEEEEDEEEEGNYAGAAGAAGAAGGGDDGEEDTVLVEVVQGDPVLVDLEKDFYKANLKYTRVLKIENDWLWSKFRNEVELMRSHSDSDFVLNMKALYHGTDAPVEVISEEGLDDRLSSRGHFGRGIYFSDDPRKCVQYSENGKDRYMLRCRVLLGDIKEYPPGVKDTKLKREPVKHITHGQKFYYDSVMGRPRDFTEYVVYERRRVLLEHVIFYTEKNPGKSPASLQQGTSDFSNQPSTSIPSTSQQRTPQTVIIDEEEEDEEADQGMAWRRHAGDGAASETVGVGARSRGNVRTATCQVEEVGGGDNRGEAEGTRGRRRSLDMEEEGDGQEEVQNERRGRRSSVDLEEEPEEQEVVRRRHRSIGNSDEDEEEQGMGEGARPRRSSVDMEEQPPQRGRRSSVDGDSDSDEVRVHPIGGDDEMEVIGAVMDDLVMDFLQVTALEFNPVSQQIAQRYIKQAPNYDVQQAIQLYFDEMDS